MVTLVQRALRAGIVPEKSDLELTRQRYLQTQDNAYKQIGAMLLRNLGLTTGQSRVSTTGIRGAEPFLPDEIIEYIRTFLQ